MVVGQRINHDCLTDQVWGHARAMDVQPLASLAPRSSGEAPEDIDEKWTTVSWEGVWVSYVDDVVLFPYNSGRPWPVGWLSVGMFGFLGIVVSNCIPVIVFSMLVGKPCEWMVKAGESACQGCWHTERYPGVVEYQGWKKRV